MDFDTMLGCHVEMVLPGKPLDAPDENHKKYISSVEEFNGERLLLTMPMLHGKFAPMHKQERYDVYIFIKTKIFQCRVLVEGAIKNESKIYLVTKVMNEFRKYERREFFRLPFSMDIFYRKLDSDLVDIYRQYLREGKEILQGGFVKGEGVDLSAGGIKFLSGERMHRRDVVVFRFTITPTNAEPITYVLLAHVIESVNHPNKSGVFIHRAAFEMQEPKMRESLVSYIFQEQRKALRKTE